MSDRTHPHVTLHTTDGATKSVFTALADDHCRAVLRILSSNRLQPPIPIETLSEAVSDFEDTPTEQAVRIKLAHSTLPRLDDDGFLKYDRHRGTVTPCEESTVPTTGHESIVVHLTREK